MTTETKQEIPQISPSAYEAADRVREAFLHAKPFRHAVIEDFFDEGFAQRLLDEFPSFDKRLALSEMGEVGGKAVNTKIATIGPAYRELYALLSSEPFLKFASRVSGIDDLILDPAMYGGGTHENLHGQELDAHVDFNFDQTNQLHRRLNLIVYLNKGWREEWGGSIEIHSNPRIPEENVIKSWAPTFNRAILFETNEYSWHGFPKIDLPEDKRSLSRKSLSIYLYTKDRPKEEVAPVHGTFYVQRPLPAHVVPGYTIGERDVVELRSLLARRDRWIETYQKRELEESRNLSELHGYVRHLEQSARVPLTGYIRQDGPASGFFPDLWATPLFKVRLTPVVPIIELTLKGFRPDDASPGKAILRINGQDVGRGDASPGSFTIAARLPAPVKEPFDFEIRFEAPSKWKAPSGDKRDLAYLVIEIRAGHPRAALLRRIKN